MRYNVTARTYEAVAVLGGAKGIYPPPNADVSPPNSPPKTKMIYTQKAKTTAEIEILGFLASRKSCIYKVSTPEKISCNRHCYEDIHIVLNKYVQKTIVTEDR